MSMQLNQRALRICERMLEASATLRIASSAPAGGARLVDCGVQAAGGLEAGRLLAECCMAGLGFVRFVPGQQQLWPGPAVQVRTDQPLAACMAAQYAGWEINVNDFFAMGSGPMRAAAGREELFAAIGHTEAADAVVGILETRALPDADVAGYIAESCDVSASDVTLLIAPTASLAGNVQIVARSVETTLHKLFELGVDLGLVNSGYGTAPLPPVARDDLAGIGRTNDAILYGGEVTLWVEGDDAYWKNIGPQIPSISSTDYGEPFAKIFKRYDHDFYKIDRKLFSPAVVQLINTHTGSMFRFGETNSKILHQSFAT
ncbi:MAG: methenyltetrahydromethanopterin cyclohydrolase [Planctomycetota bacterium]|nr:methenyltetrahydromethanopterin cyclohydrolase [Planctomycetota bacterium]